MRQNDDHESDFDVEKQAYSEWQDFPPFPLLETRSFFLIWYYTIKRSDNWAWGRSK